MILKFSCDKCGKDIVVQYLCRGEPVQCNHCGASMTVPRHAVEGSSDDLGKYQASISPSPPVSDVPIAKGALESEKKDEQYGKGDCEKG